ncbi:MAG: HutD family protein [Myxococcales bacterium]|nr:HutD family protein [Myxococcales bacterium]
MPTLTRRTPAELTVRPWRNGGGVTTELWVSPEGADFDQFLWRVSIATVAASGPFSRFEGVDRVIVQLDGPPMTLEHPGGASHTLAPLRPYAFAGELETAATVTGTARDLNLMLRRHARRGTLTVYGPEASATLTLDASEGEVLVWLARGAATLTLADQSQHLEAGELAHVAGGLCGLAGADATLVVVDVRPY